MTKKVSVFNFAHNIVVFVQHPLHCDLHDRRSIVFTAIWDTLVVTVNLNVREIGTLSKHKQKL